MYEVLLIIEKLRSYQIAGLNSESDWSRDQRRIGIRFQSWIEL